MIFRSKVTLLAVLSIIYLFFFVIPRLSSDIDDPDLVEPSWRWQYTRPATLPSYRAAPPPPTDAIVESSIYTLSNQPDNDDNNNVVDDEQQQQQQPTPTPPIEQEQQQDDAHSYDPNEKFITFFTHSGFQNQLIQGNYHCTLFIIACCIELHLVSSGEWHLVGMVPESHIDPSSSVAGRGVWLELFWEITPGTYVTRPCQGK